MFGDPISSTGPVPLETGQEPPALRPGRRSGRSSEAGTAPLHWPEQSSYME